MDDVQQELDDAAYEALVRRHRQIGAQVGELRAEMLEIEQRIAANAEVGWRLLVDGVPATLRQANRSFDNVSALTLLPADVKAACVVTKYDDALLRKAAKDAGIYDACMAERVDAAPILKLS